MSKMMDRHKRIKAAGAEGYFGGDDRVGGEVPEAEVAETRVEARVGARARTRARQAASGAPAVEKGRCVDLAAADNRLVLTPNPAGCKEFVEDNESYLPTDTLEKLGIEPETVNGRRYHVWSEDQTLAELLRDHTEGGGWEWVSPREIGALTDGPILRSPDGDIYWHERYQIESASEELLTGQRVRFEGSPDNKAADKAAKRASSPPPGRRGGSGSASGSGADDVRRGSYRFVATSRTTGQSRLVVARGGTQAEARAKLARRAPLARIAALVSKKEAVPKRAEVPPPAPFVPPPADASDAGPKRSIGNPYRQWSVEALSAAIEALTGIDDFENAKAEQQAIQQMAEELRSRPVETGQEAERDPGKRAAAMSGGYSTNEDTGKTLEGDRSIPDGRALVEDHTGIEYPATTMPRNARRAKLFGGRDRGKVREGQEGAKIDWKYCEECGVLHHPDYKGEHKGGGGGREDGKQAGGKGARPKTGGYDACDECGRPIRVDGSEDDHQAMDDGSELCLSCVRTRANKKAAEMQPSKAVSLAGEIEEKLKALYLEAKPLAALDKTRPVREAVESIYGAMRLFGEAKKLFVKLRMAEEAEEQAEEAAAEASKKRSGGKAAGGRLANGLAVAASEDDEDRSRARHTVMTTNNGYDSILLVDGNDAVVGAWVPATEDDVENYLRDGADASNWDANYPEYTDISDYGEEVGRDGSITDERRSFWRVASKPGGKAAGGRIANGLAIAASEDDDDDDDDGNGNGGSGLGGALTGASEVLEAVGAAL